MIHRIAPDLGARIAGQRPPISSRLDTEIDALWRAAQARAGGALFNGAVFCVDDITPTLLRGHMTEFRRVVAQMDRPELYRSLGIRHLAVCGVVWCRDGVVLGRRAPEAVYFPGIWQLPPAGSVDVQAVRPDGSLDLKWQLLRELDEELGLPPESIAELRPLCMVEHPGSHVLDVGFLMRTALDAAAVIAAHAHGGNGEYEDLTVVACQALGGRIAGLGDQIVPTAPAFLRDLGLLPEHD